MLPLGRCLGVDALDGAVQRLDDSTMVAAKPLLGDRGHTRRTREEGLELGQEAARLLVGLDPRWRRIRILEHPVGHRPLTGGGVVLDREPLAPERQIVERTTLHRLADLPLDEAFPAVSGLRPSFGVLALRAHRLIVARRRGPVAWAILGPVPRQNARPRVRLRDVTLDDADMIDSWEDHRSEFNDFGTRRDPVDREALSKGPLRGERNGMLIVELLDGRLIGSVSWHLERYGPNPESAALNFGIELLPETRGNGYGTEAQAQLVAYLFATTDTNRVEAGTDIDNVAEQRALEKAGLRREGVLRGSQFRAGAYRDLVVYGLVRADLES